MPAPHDLDPPSLTEAERLALRRQQIAIAIALDEIHHPEEDS